jgi:hypothetical protein
MGSDNGLNGLIAFSYHTGGSARPIIMGTKLQPERLTEAGEATILNITATTMLSPRRRQQ